MGHVGRAHGVRGDVFIALSTERLERVAVGSRLWGRDRWMTVTASHTAGKKSRVHFEGIDDRNAAEALTGTKLFAEPIDDPDELWVHHLIDASVVEADGTDRGRCVAVVANPASDLLELDGGALVPAVFVKGVTRDGHITVVTIEPPDGLFELNEP